MSVDTCEHCKGPIYPDDEKVCVGYDLFHVECSELIHEEDEIN